MMERWSTPFDGILDMIPGIERGTSVRGNAGIGRAVRYIERVLRSLFS